jgi:hypothetical protein
MIHFLFGKEQAVFPHHDLAHYSARKAPAFKPHPPAAVRGTRFPSYKIINTFVAINKHQDPWTIGGLKLKRFALRVPGYGFKY